MLMCFLYSRKDFRVDFKQLVAMRSLIPNALVLALTATAPPAVIRELSSEMEMSLYKTVKASPNRPNIFLQKDTRNPNPGNHDNLLRPIAQDLRRLQEAYPMTIVYVKMNCLVKVHRMYEELLPEKNDKGL